MMNTINILYLFVALVAAECGTPYPRRWPIPIPWPPEPDPPPCLVCGTIASLVGGFIGWGILTFAFPAEVTFVASAVSGFIFGRFFADLYGAATRGPATRG